MAGRVRTAERERERQPEGIKLLEELEQGLQIDENALDEALLQQPDLIYRVSKELAMFTSRRDALKQEVQTQEAESELEIRKAAAKREEKVTEGEVKARIKLDKLVIEVQNDLLEMANKVALFTALKEAFQQRSYVLKDLVSLYIANYYSSSSEGGTQSRMKDADAQRVKDHHRVRRQR